MNIILLGPPGSGKGTQGDIIAAALDIRKLSTGDIVRDAINKDTDIGRRAKSYLNSGDLLPDVLIAEMLEAELKPNDWKYGFILDGFPRTIGQAEALDQIMRDHNTSVNMALEFAVDVDTVTERIENRRQCGQCKAIYNILTNPPKEEGRCDACGKHDLQGRSDDDPEIIKHRFAVYEKEIAPVIAHYKEKPGVEYIMLNANQALTQVAGQIEGHISDVQQRRVT